MSRGTMGSSVPMGCRRVALLVEDSKEGVWADFEGKVLLWWQIGAVSSLSSCDGCNSSISDSSLVLEISVFEKFNVVESYAL